MTRNREDGQTLVLFVIILTLLIGIAALVVDVGMKYSLERRYQAISDASSLAGAQELQPQNRSDPVTGPMRTNARSAALRAITDELLPDLSPADAMATCDTSANLTDCPLPGGGFEVSIITPSPECVDCQPERAVQVTVREPEHPTGFSRLFGQTTWNLSRTSVAGLSFGRNYTIVALRPPASGRLPDVYDITLNGNNTTVSVVDGDVASNANMQYNGVGAKLELDPNYRMFYYDPTHGPLWDEAGRGPVGEKIGSMVPDPKYPVPARPTTEYTMTTGRVDPATCEALVTASILSQPQYLLAAQELSVVDDLGVPDWGNVNCYNPGTYTQLLSDGNQELTVLLPGLYYFSRGLDIQSMLVGGFDPTDQGVTLEFPRDQQFKQRNGAVILNAGTKFRNAGGTEPTTAPGMTGTDPNLKMTLIVIWDPACPVVLPYPPSCHDNQNKALDLAGGTALYLGGVQYAPSDNSVITGSSDGNGYAGQIWAWTLTYSGGTTLNQEGLHSDGPGTIRIDTACSPGDDTGCN